MSFLVLERLISLRTAMKKPLWLFILGGVISVTCLFVAYFVFQSSSGFMMSLLVTIAVTPLMLRAVRYEERKEEEEADLAAKENLIARHKDILKIYTAFFSGAILTLSMIYIILPSATVAKIFSDQINEINIVRGNAAFPDTFMKIFPNNLGVLLLSFVFSFLFGAGAVFILTWNASLLATAIGMAATKNFGGFKGLPLAVLAFFPHGSLEILAYFIGGVAGGLISAALSRRKSPRFSFILKDTVQLMVLSVLILTLAAIIESTEIVLG